MRKGKYKMWFLKNTTIITMINAFSLRIKHSPMKPANLANILIRKNIVSWYQGQRLVFTDIVQTAEGQRRSEFHFVGLENSETPSTSSVWPSDHREDYRSCARPFYSLVQILKRCTLTNKAVGTIWRALSKPPQRRQGPDPRPLWLLVGTPSAFGP